jgi:hypothetical protein
MFSIQMCSQKIASMATPWLEQTRVRFETDQTHALVCASNKLDSTRALFEFTSIK